MTTIQAMAVKSGMATSKIASAMFLKVQPVALPPVLFPSGGTFGSAVTVTMGTATSGGTIRFTVDGSAVTSSSAVYSGPITISGATTVNAMTFKQDHTESGTATGSYTIMPPAATPTISPPGGQFEGRTAVTLSTTTAGATIHWTSDGSTVTEASPVYTGSFNVTGDGMTTIQAMAVKSGMATSKIASAMFLKVQPVALPPVLFPSGGTFGSAVTVTMGTATSGGTIRFTVDGSAVTSSSAAYSGPITISGTTTVNAMTFKQDHTESGTATGSYTIMPPAATPTISPPGGQFEGRTTVTLSTTTAGATIHWTSDGSTVTEA